MDLILWRHAEAEAGSPDSARKLTGRGQEEARRIAAWLKPRLPGNCEVLVSPAARAQQTALALGVPFLTSPAVGTDAAAADVIAAIAPYACDLFVSQPCAPSRPIAMIDYRGTSDNVVPYAGGVITIPIPGETRQITFLGATQTFEKIRNLNGCTRTPQTTHSNCSTYATCNQGVETTLCTVQNGGHTWGDSSVAWSVLKNHTLP